MITKITAFGFAGAHHLIENRLEGQLHSGKLCQAYCSWCNQWVLLY